MRELESILSDFKATFAAVERESKARAEVMESEEYQTLQRVIDGVKAEQDEMLSKVSDTREELEADKKELAEWMRENQTYVVDGFKAKTRVQREVDTRATLEALGGDIDAMMLISSIKIGALETFIKDNPDLRKHLKPCIIEKGMVVTDIVPDTSTPA